jgi:hypothetical protein
MVDHLKRAIPKDYDYNPKALKPLARMLWAMSVALGHAMTAHRQFAKVKSSTISPDGLIGGRGYVMSIKDVRKALYDACESLSAISDTVHDELNASHWKPKLAELESSDVETVERLVGEAERNMDDPDRETKDDMEEVEQEGDRVDLDGDGEGRASRTPDGKDLADNYVDPKSPADPVEQSLKQASLQARVLARTANSSIPPSTLPGPRVEDLDRTNDEDLWSLNDAGPREYDYNMEWENRLESPSATVAGSGLPVDRTPTDADSFGLGDGHGGGLEVPNPTSTGKGVYGPHSELPGGAASLGVSDTTPVVELAVGQSRWKAATLLPQDVLPPVARSDYYPQQSASSGIPEVPDTRYDHDLDVPGVGERLEQSQPYIKWDYTTRSMRPDYTYQREVQGPYVAQDDHIQG